MRVHHKIMNALGKQKKPLYFLILLTHTAFNFNFVYHTAVCILLLLVVCMEPENIFKKTSPGLECFQCSLKDISVPSSMSFR